MAALPLTCPWVIEWGPWCHCFIVLSSHSQHSDNLIWNGTFPVIRCVPGWRVWMVWRSLVSLDYEPLRHCWPRQGKDIVKVRFYCFNMSRIHSSKAHRQEHPPETGASLWNVDRRRFNSAQSNFSKEVTASGVRLHVYRDFKRPELLNSTKKLPDFRSYFQGLSFTL